MHTPGPWEVSDERECEQDWFASIISHGKDARGVEIARLTGGAPYRDDEGMANASLIAAAPELLAACKVWLEMLLENGAPEDSVQMKLVRAAIAKAEGQ